MKKVFALNRFFVNDFGDCVSFYTTIAGAYQKPNLGFH